MRKAAFKGWIGGIFLLLTWCFVACGSSDNSPAEGGDLDSEAEFVQEDDLSEEREGDWDVLAQYLPVIETISDSRNPFDYCEENQPPDDACHREKRAPDSENIQLAQEIVDKQIALHAAEDVEWDWGEAVMMLGVAAVYRVTQKAEYLDYIRKYIDHHMQIGYMMESSDKCAPSSLALFLLRETGEEKYRAVLDDAFDYLYRRALRTEEGGLNHLGTWDALGVTLWVDSLFMFGNVLTGWGEYADDDGALDEYVYQFNVFTDLLQEESGFYKHAIYTIYEQTDNVYWGRGNAWVTAAGYDHLRVRYDRGETVPSIREALDKQVAAFLEYQDEETGLWHTIMNRPAGGEEEPENYLETSVAALFSIGMAKAYRYGFRDDAILPVIEKAMEGVRSRIERDSQNRPVITGISGPTSVGTYEYYADLTQKDDISYGVGAVLMALVETSGLPSSSER